MGVADGVWKLAVRAPPLDGRANEAVRRLLARELGISRGRIHLKRGASARLKTFETPLSQQETNAALTEGLKDGNKDQR